jgi:hypothetical protein
MTSANTTIMADQVYPRRHSSSNSSSKANDQLGISDVVAIGACSQSNLICATGKFAGPTPGTSLASKYLSNLISGTSPIRLPTITGYPGVSNGIKLSFTKSFGRFVGRTLPVIGWGIALYDLAMILEATYNTYTAITAGGC